MNLLPLPTLTVRGSPAEMGRQHGAALRAAIRGFIDQRQRAAKVYLYERGIRDLEPLNAITAACLDALRSWDHDGWIEHQATAEAAGVDPVALYLTANMTDVRDVLALPAPAQTPAAEAEGCSTALVPGSHTADGAVLVAQTWDLNPTDLEFVVAVQRLPDHGPEQWTVSCTGCPSLMGMNAHGLAFGTTNIRVRGGRPGIPYLSLLHRAARCGDRAAAAALVGSASRCAAHTYWFADVGGALDLECSTDRSVRRDADQGPLNRTNHCLDAQHQASEGEAPSSSSKARLQRVGQRLAAGRLDVAAIKTLFADRNDGVDSVNRFAEDNQGTATDACLIAVPARRELHACRGSADRGAWTVLPFG